MTTSVLDLDAPTRVIFLHDETVLLGRLPHAADTGIIEILTVPTMTLPLLHRNLAQPRPLDRHKPRVPGWIVFLVFTLALIFVCWAVPHYFETFMHSGFPLLPHHATPAPINIAHTRR